MNVDKSFEIAKCIAAILTRLCYKYLMYRNDQIKRVKDISKNTFKVLEKLVHFFN